MRASLAVFAALLSVSCSRPPSLLDGLDPVVANAIQGCDRLEPVRRDWCAVQFVGPELATGPAVYELCRRLRDPLARDRCLESAARNSNEPAPAVVCESIADARIRQACWVSAAAGIGASDPVAAMKICGQVPAVLTACAQGVIGSRATNWTQDAPDLVGSDVATIAGAAPSLAASPDLARAVGRATRRSRMVVASDAVCAAFDPGNARLACLNAHLADKSDG
jgi:hypothetical protein